MDDGNRLDLSEYETVVYVQIPLWTMETLSTASKYNADAEFRFLMDDETLIVRMCPGSAFRFLYDDETTYYLAHLLYHLGSDSSMDDGNLLLSLFCLRIQHVQIPLWTMETSTLDGAFAGEGSSDSSMDDGNVRR